MARPVDYRKSRGGKGVHTEDEPLPTGKNVRPLKSTQQDSPPAKDPKPISKHAGGHAGQKPKRR